AEEPDRNALIWVNTDASRDEFVTFKQMSERSNKVAHMLLKHGLKKGNRVLLVVHRTPDWHYLMVGMFKVGIIPMPGTNLLTPHDIEYRMNRAEAKAVIVSVEHAAKFDEVQEKCPTLSMKMVLEGECNGWISYSKEFENAPVSKPELPETKADEPMLIYFTSGTTSYPKMVLHTHGSYGYGHIVTAKYWQDLHAGDVHWTMSDTGWAKAAWGKMFGQWHQRASVFMRDARGKFNPQLTLELIQKYHISTFCAPPTVYRMLILEDLTKYDLSSIKHSLSAGEPLNPEVIEQWKVATSTVIHDGFGQTETVNIIANFKCNPIKFGSMGKAVPGFTIEIVDDEGNVLPPNTEGQIAILLEPVRPVGLMSEYWHDDEANSRAFRGKWYYTGDKATKDEDGYFWFVGRADDVIKASGYRIGPFEVESALQEHPAVAESAVVGSPDEIRGVIVKAFIILKPGLEGDAELIKEIQDFVKKRTAPYKYPREIEFVKELPKTLSGKIKRNELRQREIDKKSK
ncbi:MAG: AMP-binding protein, partial [Planctomycetes bacterium]|nr:AMP-binding protein [Planctomycetota bacterium]